MKKVKFLYDKVMEITEQVGKDHVGQYDSFHFTADYLGTVYTGYEGRCYDSGSSGVSKIRRQSDHIDR